MTSPVDNGNYVSYWGLKKVDGAFMPIAGGANGKSFYVKIKVNNGRTPGNVTAASIAIEPEQGSVPTCTAESTYFVHASITTNGPTTVTYEIDSTASSPHSILRFLWHTRGVALAYRAGLFVAAIMGATLGMQPATEAGRGSSFTLPFIASLLPKIVHVHQGTTCR